MGNFYMPMITNERKHMTSIKKPFIAIASAVALVATAFLASPANASTTALTVNGTAAATAGTSSATAVVLPVPSDNSVDSADALRIGITGLTAGSSVTATATNAKLVSAVTSGASTVSAAAGLGSLTVSTGTGTTADIYVYTTTTEVGSVAVSIGGNVTTYFVKGTAGSAYNLAVVAPTVANVGGTTQITATTTDVFGNAVTNATISSVVIRGSVGTFTYNATTKRYEATFTAPAVSGSAIVANSITATAVAGLPKPALEVVSTIGVSDLAGQIALLEAKVAELEAKVSSEQAKAKWHQKRAIDNKNKYNRLAKRWNKVSGFKDVPLIK
jgi:hypothetical protein